MDEDTGDPLTQDFCMTHDDLAAHARSLINANLYLVLGTTDPDGRPWTSPVYFAPAGDREFYWVSATDARHSVHVAERPQVSLVIFDSTVAPYQGRAVYAVGEARELSGSDLRRALEVYPRPGDTVATRLTSDEVTGSAPYRMYRASASDLWVLCPREPGQPCPLHGRNEDHRARVPAA
jgi:nitroimidazol reductase NimA-like FMN-containing flavoprotein (pyridoxamine 5'-phosphate oxidase superfamily)